MGEHRRIFSEEQIQSILERQRVDVFEELVQLKHEQVIDKLKQRNLVEIEDMLNQMVESNRRSKSLTNRIAKAGP